MNKVLMVTYLPFATPRIPGLAKYLPEFGWQPLVITPPCPRQPNSGLRVIETGYRDASAFVGRLLGVKTGGEDLRKQVEARLGNSSRHPLLASLLTLGGAVINYPDSERGWKPFAVAEGGRIIREEDIAIIMSSSAPVTSHVVAAELKREWGRPWLADLRDLWSQNHNYSYGPIRRLIDRSLETRTLAGADALLTVSQPWADRLTALHKGKTAYVVTHGFHPAEVNRPPCPLDDKFTITYTGTVYARHDPAKLLAALRALIAGGEVERDDVRVRFYGRHSARLDGEIARYGLGDVVKQYGHVSRDIALEKQRQSQLLLRMKWEDPGEHGAYSGKIFEYLAARRPIIATGGGEDVVSGLLKETGAGISAQTVNDIKKALQGLYKEYKQKGRVSYKGESAEVNEYSYRELARRLALILDGTARRPVAVAAGEMLPCRSVTAVA